MGFITWRTSAPLSKFSGCDDAVFSSTLRSMSCNGGGRGEQEWSSVCDLHIGNMCQSRIVGISSKWEKDLPLRGHPPAH